MTKKSAPKKQTKKREPKNKLVLQIKDLNLALKEEKDKYLRLFAEFENFKKRNAKEKDRKMNSLMRKVDVIRARREKRR